MLMGAIDRALRALRPGKVRISLQARRKVTEPGGRLEAVLRLAPEGRGGRVRGVAVLLLRDEPGLDAPVFVEAALWGLDFEVRPGVEVTCPVSVEVPEDAEPSGVAASYRLVATGKVRGRELQDQLGVVLLPASGQLRRAS